MAGAIVLIMGPPGAGKGTQAAHVAQSYGLRHVSTGDMLREAVAGKTPMGLEAQGFMERGELVPDDVMIGLIKELLEGLDESTGVLLDGFPRTLEQAVALDHAVGDAGRSIGAVLDIEVPTETLVERLSSRWICRTCQTPYNAITKPPKQAGVCDIDGGELYQRPDDTSDAVRKRLTVYQEQTAPVSGYYDDQGLRHVIDGDQDPADVQTGIDEALSSLARA